MADPICRWRNPYLITVIDLIKILPKEELPQQKAREIVNSRFRPEFYRTPYQLACQLGLYHETNGHYFPKFTFEPSKEEVFEYLVNWIQHYCVPNPYTKGFDSLKPFSIHSILCQKLINAKKPIPYNSILLEIFEEPIGNTDILKNALNTYSPVLLIKDDSIKLKENKALEDLKRYISTDINTNRYNKEYFFDLFPLPSQRFEKIIINSINQEDTSIINQLIEVPNLTLTEKNQIINARIGQGLFRRSLILECNFCPITLVDDSKLLIASHIKPWRNSNNIERLNPKNGILLTPTFDKLFDEGLISFENNKSLLISSEISKTNTNKLNLVPNMIFPKFPIHGREEFLEYHRNEIFKK
jgi:hypothetical protein